MREADAALSELPADFASVTGERLVNLITRFRDHPGLEHLLNQLDERERRLNPSWDWRQLETDQDRQITALMASGMDQLDAYAQVYRLDVDELHRQQARAHLHTQRLPGEGADALARRLYGEWIEAQFLAAEHATRGVLVNKRGRAQGVDGRSLLHGSPRRAAAYASEELKAWWHTHPRLTLTEFRAQLLHRDADVKAARRHQEDRT
ncbi:hypothetical protein AB0K48_00640 [Nonomuraea sp. NPDC055795]